MPDGAVLTHCASCRFWQRGNVEGLCRRHAPLAFDRPYVAARWPETRAADGCGEGEPVGPDHTASAQVCRGCVYWDRPGNGIDPAQRGDHVSSWWREAGYCRRHAPHPGADIGYHGYWRATHASDYCFEGAPAAGKQFAKADIVTAMPGDAS